VRGTLLWIAGSRPLSAPAAGEGLVFFVEPEGLTALRQTDGTLAWRHPFGDPLSGPLVWDNGWLLAGASTGSILAFRASDGQQMWRYELGERLNAPPALGTDRIYLPLKDNRVVALRLASGEPLWEQQLGGLPNEIFALDERIYVGADDNYFYCIKAANGEVDWRWRTGGDVRGRAAFDGERVFFVSFDNVLRAVDYRSGNQRWMRPLPLRPTTSAVVAAGTILVAGLSPVVRAYTLADGSPAGEITLDGEVAGAPYLLEPPDLPAPAVVTITRDIVKGAVVRLMQRSVEPAAAPPAPLPNAIPPPAVPAEP
jgi:outer membrane protein assembly factor BamB